MVEEKLKSRTPLTSRGTYKIDVLERQGLSCNSDLYHLQNVKEFLIPKDPSARQRRSFLEKKNVQENDLELVKMPTMKIRWMICKMTMMILNNFHKAGMTPTHL